MTTATQTADASNTQTGQASTTTATSATGAPDGGQQQAAPAVASTDTGSNAQADVAPGEKAATTESKPSGAPESYDFKLPEGVTMDESGLSAYSEFAKSQGLTQEAAQAQLEALAPAMQKSATERMTKVKTQWLDEAKADKDFGGEKFTENLNVADRALNQLGTPALTALLKETGLNHHPEVIRMLVKAGKAMSEDGSFVSGGKAQAQLTIAQRMFPNMNP